MPEDKRPLKVFLCHAHSDKNIVRDLYQRLTKDGVDAWLDKEKLLPGHDWELEIRKAVREADVVVVCLSRQFNQAGFRQKEVRLALDTAMERPEGEIFIIPAKLEECDNLESLRKWHWVDLFEEDGYERLMRALQARAVKIGVTLEIRKSRAPRTRKPNEVITTENDKNKTNTFEPININSNSVIKKGKLDKVERHEKARVEKEEIKKRRLPYFETPIARKNVTRQDSEDVSLSGSSVKHKVPQPREGFSSKKPKDKILIKTEYIVAIIGAAATIIAGILGAPVIEKWLSPAPVSTASATATMTLTSQPVIPSSTIEPSSTFTEVFNPTVTREVFNPHPNASDYFDSFGVPMRRVSAGQFTMGSDNGESDEKPIHTVDLDAYYMDKYEVTNALYKTCVDAGVCQSPQNTSSFTIYDLYGNPDYDNYPVMFMSWNMAKTYCEWRGAQLPTEAQWEKAARGTDGRTYPWGEEIDQTFAHYDQSAGIPAAVGSYERGKSPYGVYDMAGNVWEWVGDWYSQTFYANSPTSNPSGPGSGQTRVLRGGTWYYGKERVRTFSRDSYNPIEVLDSFGFRCAKDANP